MEALAARCQDAASYAAGHWCVGDLWKEMLSDEASTVEARAHRFHRTIARWTCESARKLAVDEDTGVVVLSGGVFQNVLLLESVSSRLEKDGLRVLVPRFLPPNDGGLALGQLYLGALQFTGNAPKIG